MFWAGESSGWRRGIIWLKKMNDLVEEDESSGGKDLGFTDPLVRARRKFWLGYRDSFYMYV